MAERHQYGRFGRYGDRFGDYARGSSGERHWDMHNRFGMGEQPGYYGAGYYADGGAGFGGGYGRQGFDEERTVGMRDPYYGALGYRDDLGNEYGKPTTGRPQDFRADYTSRRAYGENPFGYYGQYHGSSFRDRFYSGGYDEGRVSTWRPDLERRYRRGPKGYQRSDERIREDISDRLMQSTYLDSSEVTVDVTNGTVTLEGTVPERRMKHAIEDLAESAPGVQDVENRIRVQRETEVFLGGAGSAATRTGDGGPRRTNA